MKTFYMTSKMKNRLKTTIAFMVVFLLLGSFAQAQEVVVPFTQRTSTYTPGKKIYNIKGDFQMIGNTNMTLQNYGDNNNNGTGNSSIYVDIDGDPNTINSSSATLQFSEENDANPECTNIIYAGLYWTGRAHNGGTSPIQFVVGESTVNRLDGNTFNGYSLAIVQTGSGTRTATYTFTPTGSGDPVVFTFTSSGTTVNSLTVQEGSGNPVNLAYTSSSGGSTTNTRWLQVNFNTPYTISTGSQTIIVNSLRKLRGNNDQSSSYFYANVTTPGKTLNKRQVKLKHASGTYQTVTANANDIYYPETTQGQMYSAYAEVTDYVKTHGIGEYFVADMALREGTGGGTGFYGGWGMIVVYENSKMRWRDITIFDGHAYMLGSTAANEVLEVSGFNTVQNGDVHMKLGLIAGEGDVDIRGDYFEIQKLNTSSWERLSHSGNTTNNFFNSSIPSPAPRNPNLKNNTGVDIAMFDINNPNNSIITNNQTSTKFRYGSTQDTYIICTIAMAVDAYVPEPEGTELVVSVGGTPVIPGSEPAVLPGQEIEYSVEIRNVGSESVNNAVATIPLPYTVDFASVSGVYYEGLSGPQPVFDPNAGATGSIIWNLGNLPLLSGNPLLANLTLKVKVTEDCFILANPNCNPLVTLNGTISGVGAQSGAIATHDFIQGYQMDGVCEGEPIYDPLALEIDRTNLDCEGDYTREFTYCNIEDGKIPFGDVFGYFPSGTRFYNEHPVTESSTEYTSSTGFPATEGTTTYYAVPPGITECWWEFKITVDVVTSIPGVQAEPITYCIGDEALPISSHVQPTNGSYILYYYTVQTGGTASTTAPTPSTAQAGEFSYWVAEGISAQCISPNRAEVKVTVEKCCTLESAEANVTKEIKCFGDETATVTITVNDDSGQLTFVLENYGTNNTGVFENVAAGTYNWSVSEAGEGCETLTGIITVNQPNAIGISLDAVSGVTDVSCFGGNDGAINIVASGGTGTYTYAWTGPDSFTASTEDISGLKAGSYSVTVTDENGCVAELKDIVITQPDELVVALDGEPANVSCFGGNDGAINIVVSGGTGTYTYAWTGPDSFTASTEDISGLKAGTYSVTVTDANGCVAELEDIVITQPDELVVALDGEPANVSCFGGNDGAINIVVSGGTGTYTYAWTGPDSFTASTEDISGLKAGTYSVTVTDANGCVAELKDIVITQPDELVVALDGEPANVSCFGGNDGAINIVVTGGTGTYTYAWTGPDSFTASTEDISGLKAGTYSVTVTDANGCVAELEDIVITQPNELVVALDGEPANVSCFGGNDGAINIVASGGTGTYTYAWTGPDSFTASTEDISGLKAGTYSVTVTDANGCVAELEDIVITQPNELAVALDGEPANVSCFGGNDGAINIVASGGTGTYTYAWTGPDSFTASTEDISGLKAGTYSVTVTDENGCVAELKDIVITQPDELVVELDGEPANVSCFGGNDGAINIVVTGGTGTYTYAWTGPDSFTASTEDISGLKAGTYSVTVTDENGCVAELKDIVITQPEELAVALDGEPANVSCFGGNDGAINIVASGGTGTYTYAWTGPDSFTASTEDISGLKAGSYSVTVTDENGCVAELKDIVVGEPTQITASAEITSEILCYGGTATISVTAIGGTGTLTFSKDGTNFQAGNEFTGLTPGSYTFTVKDANDCTVTTDAVVVNQPEELICSASQVSGVTIYGASDGVATVNVTGGVEPYTYEWDNGETTQTATALNAGTHTVTVTDNNNCETTCEVTITQPGQLSCSIDLISNVSCYGEADGKAKVEVSGGVTPYTYTWDNGETGATATALNAGSHSVLVKDANGAETTCTVVISQPDELVVQLSAADGGVTYVSCFGGNDGAINIVASGGTGTYTYAWTGPDSFTASTEDISGLKAGSYSVTVTDENGCVAELKDIVVGEPTQITASAEITSEILCYGGTATISVTAIGGTGTLTFSKDGTNFQAGNEFTGLTPGSYTFTVKDANGCTVTTDAVVVNQPEELICSASQVSGVTIYGASDGVATVNVTGGVEPYAYAWDNGETTQTATALNAGTHTVTVTDNNNCETTCEVTITQPGQLSCSIDLISNVSCYGEADGKAKVEVSGGVTPYIYTWDNGETGATATALNAGSHSVLVKDANGAETTCTVVISQPDELVVELDGEPANVTCNNAADGTISISVEGGTEAYTIVWTKDGETFTAEDGYNLTGLEPGSYAVTVTDANGCVAELEDIVITQPDELVVALDGEPANVSCNDAADGTISISVEGGTEAYTIVWTKDGETFAAENGYSLTGLEPGSYAVTVTDANGCVAELEDIVITQPDELVVELDGEPANVTCNDAADGTISISVEGGTEAYTIVWTKDGETFTAEDGYNLTGLEPGSYAVTVTDANGCVAELEDIVITQPDELVVELDGEPANVTCNDAADGTISISVEGGTEAYTIVWTKDGETFAAEDGYSLTGLEPGSYAVTVTDANGCVAELEDIVITQPDELVVELDGEPANVSCNDAADGTISISVEGGTEAYTIVWTKDGETFTAENGYSLTGLEPGSYAVTVTDANGCVAELEDIVITQPDELVVELDGEPANVSCNDAADGTISISVEGGTEAYTIVWTKDGETFAAENGYSLTGLEPGSYAVTVTDANGCVAELEDIVITQPDELVVALDGEPANVSCNDAADGTISISVEGGTEAYTIVWTKDGETFTTEDGYSLTGLEPGSYAVTVTDANGCVAELEDIVITQPDELVVELDGEPANVSCYDAADGTISISVEGGTEAYTIVWTKDGETFAAENGYSLTGLEPGSYAVTVTDANGCVAELEDIVITQPDELVVELDGEPANVSCYDAADGTISISVEGGTEAYTIVWTKDGETFTAEDGYNLTGLEPGSYAVTVTDANGCVAELEDIVITQPELLSCNIEVNNNVSINALDDGSATVIVSGGNEGDFTYLWDNGETTQTAINLSAGIHTVLVTDSKGCQTSCEVEITQPDVLECNVRLSSPISCAGEEDAVISVFVGGGYRPYTYEWSTGHIVPTVNNLGAGTYFVTVTDAMNAQTECSITIEAPEELVADLAGEVTDVTCFGGSDGAISIVVSGGTEKYGFTWTKDGEIFSTEQNLTGLSAGTYAVEVTDAHGCTAVVQDIIVGQPDELVVSLEGEASSVTCFGAADGAISIAVSGGTGEYTIVWTKNGEPFAAEDGYNLTGLEPGAYAVVVYDAHQCSATLDEVVVITQPDELTVSLEGEITDVICYGDSNGAISIAVSGGTGKYGFTWTKDGEAFTPKDNYSLSALAAGIYSVVVTDENGCSAELSGIVVASPEAALACSTEMTKPVTEYGQSNGEATVTATGGWGDYTYIWSNGQTTTTATGLEAGTYTVTVTDSRGCETTCEVTITGPDQLVCSIEMDSPVVCYGGADGKATVTVTGGVTPYTYAWDNGETGATAIGLDAGTHTVTVTDASGAQSTCEVIITQPESALQLTAEALNVVTCYDGSDGQATAEATGGWGSYTYSWSNGQTTATATGLEAGVYTVTVTDAQGCEDTREVEIAGPATALECSAEVVSHVTIADANNGEAVVFANGGWGDYTYHWSNGQATANAMGLAPGTYTVTVTDAQGCETQCSVTILLDVTEEDCELYIPDAFSPNDDGSNDYFKVLCIEKYPNAKFEVYNRWGNLLYEQENYGNQDRWNSIDAWWDGTSNRKWTVGREKLPMGTYFYILHLNDGSKPITGSVFLNK